MGELRALGDVGQAVSSTLDLQTVLSTIVGHAVQLSGTDSGVIYEYDEEKQEFHLRASHRMEEELVEAIAQRRYAVGRVLRDERRLPELRLKSLIYWRSGNSGPRGSGPLPRDMDIARFWPFRFSANTIMGALTVWRKKRAAFRGKSSTFFRRSPRSPPWRSRTHGCFARSRTKAGSWSRQSA